MAAVHNHEPRCCCDWDPRNPLRRRACPVCPAHGILAQLDQAVARMAHNPPEDN